jgi:3'(2'), 5'-bisphosphate nucleotidase
LDPIDGTKGFLRGDQYAIALALILSGKVQVGVLGCPNLVEGHRSQMGGEGSLLVAVRGEGAWWASLMDETAAIKPVRVSDRDGAAEARLLRSFESGHTNVSQVDLFADALGVQAEPVRMDSQAKYAVLAAGYGEIYLRLLSPKQPDYREKIWDQAAGSLIVEEAGGRVTDLQGRPLDFSRGRTLANNRGVLATNGRLHEAALQGLKAIQA